MTLPHPEITCKKTQRTSTYCQNQCETALAHVWSSPARWGHTHTVLRGARCAPAEPTHARCTQKYAYADDSPPSRQWCRAPPPRSTARAWRSAWSGGCGPGHALANHFATHATHPRNPQAIRTAQATARVQICCRLRVWAMYADSTGVFLTTVASPTRRGSRDVLARTLTTCSSVC